MERMMRNRQSADPRADPFFSRTSATLARSPAERLEPTQPARRNRRRQVYREPRRTTPVVRFLSGLLTLAFLSMLFVGTVGYLLDARIDGPGPLERNKIIVIPKGKGTHEIAELLEREGVVTDRRLFIAGFLWTKLAALLDGTRNVHLKAGDYEVRQHASIRQVLDVISEGKTITYKVTVPEGLTSYQIVERLKADQYLSGDIAEVPVEGTLLPETFIVPRGASRQAIIDNMETEARKLQERSWAQRKKDLPLKSWEQAVILASIVEKETGRNDERERVAAVFVNRLRNNMRLQSDPTILYGVSGGKTAWGRPILKSEIAQKTTHNTYQIEGLPPTPICNPGRAAIEAVLNPADTKDLYFVADGAGGHVFAETLKDHNANVLKWRAAEKEMKAKAAPGPQETPVPTTNDISLSPKSRAVVRTAPSDKAPRTEPGTKPSTPAAPSK
jgi:UPF0755 protein